MKLLLPALLLAASLPGRAQLLPPPSDTDTTSHPDDSGLVRYRMGTLTRVDGTTIQGYMPCNRIGYGGGKLRYFMPPLSIDAQLRHPHTIKMDEIQRIDVYGRLYEPMRLKGKAPDVLALHLVEGPISLAVYVEPRTLPLPLPLPMVGYTAVPLLNFKLSDKDHWYVRRDGICTEIPRAHFAELMSAYLADNPELAGKVARQEPHYLHADTPAIVAEYNRARTAGQ
ncbi:hypothetical protein MUN81_10885 [Hymenobacter sp. 5317J-9]|uniref:hypothetical protein n=1 Tax=Hymenobacter sp. 5317J-9 TaxID=2932250 RepID=UPI001FD71F73|nr:hypothetical protein [Hymenobacter sp. 5317J-9]UOQ99982.1 hypothetical protein MUN81_10885 [Hymenobacter sp. 5317J-9]